MTNLQAKDWLIIGLLSLLVGVLYIGPTVAYRLELGKDYHGISLSIGYDQEHYTTLIREIYDGNNALNNGYLFEETHGPRANPNFVSTTHVQFLSILVSGELGKLLHLSVDDLDLLMKGTFPALIFAALAILGIVIGMTTTLAIPVALFAVFFPQIWTGIMFLFPGWQPYAQRCTRLCMTHDGKKNLPVLLPDCRSRSNRY
jgi:hypothetical protein